jgi:hypothetical protein
MRYTIESHERRNSCRKPQQLEFVAALKRLLSWPNIPIGSK